MKRFFLAAAASAMVLVGMVAIPAGAGASIQRHGVPARFSYVSHAKTGNINSLSAKQRKRILAAARYIRTHDLKGAKTNKARQAAAAHDYIGSYYGPMDFFTWDDDLYYDGFYTYGYYSTCYDYYYGYCDSAYTWWFYDPSTGYIYGLFTY